MCISAATVILQYQNSRVLILQLGVIMKISRQNGAKCAIRPKARSHCESFFPLHIWISLLSHNLVLALFHMIKLLLLIITVPTLDSSQFLYNIRSTKEHVESSCIFTAIQIETAFSIFRTCTEYSVEVSHLSASIGLKGTRHSSLYDIRNVVWGWTWGLNWY